jgi:hypothetical protein
LHSTNWSDGEKKNVRKQYSSSIEDVVGNEENE